MDAPTDISNSQACGWVQETLARFERPLLAYAQRILRCHSRAEDVVQETFLRLCQQSPAELEGHLAEWLFAVCRNQAIDIRRKEQRMTTTLSTGSLPTPAEQSGPELPLEQADETRRILGVLDKLPESQQEVIRLKFQGELSYREISRITGRSVSNVGYLIHQGLTTLRRRLASS